MQYDNKTQEIIHEKYKIQRFTANNKKSYRAVITLKNNKKWYSENFYKSAIEAGDEARAQIYN